MRVTIATRNRHPRVARTVRRTGFTLAEILVALAIMATLAAVLIPAVAGQIMKGEANRAIQDITNIRTGIEQFVADVHRYPGKVSHLATQITNLQRDVNNTLYPNSLVNRWRGPYLGRDTLPGGYQTGFGALVRDSLVLLTSQPGVNYATVVIAGITQTDFNKMDADIDGTVGATTGMLRWVTGGVSGVDTVKFLTIPIQ